MPQADADTTTMALNPEAGDDRLSVRFYRKSVLNELKSHGGNVDEEVVNADGTVSVIKKRIAGAGHPVYENKEYIEIRVPGDKLAINDRPVTRRDKMRFARQYQAFAADPNAKQGPGGTPLTALGMDQGLIEELQRHSVHTTQQLEGIPDGNLSAIGAGVTLWKQKAKDFNAASKGYAPTAELRAENQNLKEQMSVLQEQMTRLMELATKPVEPDAKAVKAKGKQVAE
jgi:hypothetical protein